MDKNPKDKLSDFEKKNLKERILSSAKIISQNRKRKKLRRYFYGGVAASLAVLVSITFYQKHDQPISIEEFANTTQQIDSNTNENVTVVLGNSEIKLNEKDTSIVYSHKGNHIKVGDHKSFNQETLNKDKLVYNTLLVPYGKRTKLELSDGTKVWVNSGSKLIYPAVFKGKNRQVYLSGEAIFNVTHNKNKPFQVISENQKIEVLGTIFNVSTYPDESNSTVLKQGSVLINYKDEKSIHLKPGQMAEYNLDNKSLHSSYVNPDNYFSWREGFLSLERTSLQQITTKLSRYYNVKIEILDQSLKEETFSGRLDLKDNIDRVLIIISNTTNIQYRWKNNKIEISKP